MKYLKISVLVILGLAIASFVVFKDYEVNGESSWPKTIKLYSNPFTGQLRVVDAETGITLFSYSVDAFAKPISFQKDGNKWVVIIEQRE